MEGLSVTISFNAGDVVEIELSPSVQMVMIASGNEAVVDGTSSKHSVEKGTTLSIKEGVVEETNFEPKAVKETTLFAKKGGKVETDSAPTVAKETIGYSRKEEEEKIVSSTKRVLEVTEQL